MLLQRIDDQSNQLVNKVGGRRLTGIEYSVQHFPVPNQSLEGSRQSSVLQGIVCISFETGCLRCKTMHAKKLCIVCNKLCHYLVCLWYSADIHILAHTRVTLFYIPAPTEGIQEYWTLKTDRKGSKNAWRPRPYVVQSRENWSGWTTFRYQNWSDSEPLFVAISGPICQKWSGCFKFQESAHATFSIYQVPIWKSQKALERDSMPMFICLIIMFVLTG